MNWTSSAVSLPSFGSIWSRLRAAASHLVLVGLLLAAVAAAVVIARGDGAIEMARLATVHAAAESVIGGAATLRADVREALVVGRAAEFGFVGPDDVTRATEYLRSAAETLTGRAAALGTLTSAAEVIERADALAAEAGVIAGHVDDGEIDNALDVANTGFASAHGELVESSAAIRNHSAASIAAVEEGMGTVTTAARFVSGLLIPAMTVFIFFRILKRSQRETLFKAEVRRERELRRKKDAFIAAASHHINTPLAAVVGFAELLRDRTRDFSAGVRNEVTELLAIQAQETAHVVDDLLVAARLDLGDLSLMKEEVDLREVLDEATGDWAGAQRARLTLSGNALTTADRKWLSHILRNLLRNATAFGGENIWVRVSEGFSRVVVEIADDGAGVPVEESERIFELYYSYRQVDGLAPSLGLGLAVARKLALAMGGDLRNLRQDSENVFALSLPKSERLSALPDQMPVVTIDPSAGRPSRGMIDDLINRGGPTMVYQSVVDLRARSQGHERIVGYEALARFPSLTPPQWFEAASAEGLRLPLELACISNAITGFRPADETQFLALNVSDSTLLASRLHEALAGIDPGRVILELSEAASIKSYETTRGVVESLATRGMRLAIDDVGSGAIDLWHISRLGTSVVKVDMTLVRSIDSNPRNRALVRGVTAMANDLGIMVVAEGIEREEEHDQLLELGVQFGQGYLYGKPGPLLWKARVLIGDDGADGQPLLTRSGSGVTRSPAPPGPRSSSRGRGRSGPRG